MEASLSSTPAPQPVLFCSRVLVVLLACRIAHGFQVFWNVPSATCLRRGVDFQLEKYGFTFNRAQKFHGEKIRIFYRPGHFPHLLENGSEVNGGIPQRGNAVYHLLALRHTVNKTMPSRYSSGPAVIDFEKWRPSFNDSPREYRRRSWNYTRLTSPVWLPWHDTLRLAERQFEFSARRFLEHSIMTGFVLRPHALWGYYQYPLCGNYRFPTRPCPVSASEELERYSYLYRHSQALYPSIYVTAWHKAHERRARMKHHLDKAQQVAVNGKPIYPYTWFQYHSEPDHFLNKTDLLVMFGEPFIRNLPGVVLWGSTNNVNTRQRCDRLKHYIDQWLGPLVKHLTIADDDLRLRWQRMLRNSATRQQLLDEVNWSSDPVINQPQHVLSKQY